MFSPHTYFCYLKLLHYIWMTWVLIKVCFFSVRQVVQVAKITAHTFPAVLASIQHSNVCWVKPRTLSSFLLGAGAAGKNHDHSVISSLPQGRCRMHHANTWLMCQLLACCWHRRMWWALWWPSGGQAWSWNPAIKEMKRGDKQKQDAQATCFNALL